MEIWKDIKDYEGHYQVSSLGRVKSLKYGKERILKQAIEGGGYLQVVLSNNKKNAKYKVHKLVCIAFLGHIPNGMKTVVDHRNGIKTDNRLENLRLVTNRENSTFGFLKKETSSKFTGVSWSKQANKWRAKIMLNGKLKHLGDFKCELPAAFAYNKALKQLDL
jgi:hypothetical protein